MFKEDLDLNKYLDPLKALIGIRIEKWKGFGSTKLYILSLPARVHDVTNEKDNLQQFGKLLRLLNLNMKTKKKLCLAMSKALT